MAKKHMRRSAAKSPQQRRWTPYICQDCRAVFRVPADYIGTGVVCPNCERMLRLPKSGEEIPHALMAIAATLESADEDLPPIDESGDATNDADVSSANQETREPASSTSESIVAAIPGERETHDQESPAAPEISYNYSSRVLDTLVRPAENLRRRKKHRDKTESADPEWQEHAEPRKLRQISSRTRLILRYAIGFAAIILLLFIASFFKQPPKNETVSPPAEIIIPTPKAHDNETNPNDQYLKEIAVRQEVVKAFLEARNVDEMLLLVRQSTIIKDRVLTHYQKQPYQVPGFSHIDDASITLSDDGTVYTAVVTTSDFSQKSIAVIKEDNQYLVDWESWVGWSAMSFEELKQTKPTQPIEIRVVVETQNYYNFDFPPEQEHLWQSYRLVAADGFTLLHGYVAKASALDNALRLSPDEVSKNAILRIKYRENSTSNAQVLIDEIVADGWLKLDARN